MTASTAELGQAAVSNAFKARTMGEPNDFLGMHLECDGMNNAIHMHQRQYIPTLLGRFGLMDAIPVRLPMGTVTRLCVDGQPLAPELAKTYQDLIGTLLYLCTGTWPDIAYVVRRLTRDVAKSTRDHLAPPRRCCNNSKGPHARGFCSRTRRSCSVTAM
eukprot:TRINITY_DN3485_c1_g1_i4.p2 TRINITY_DN3485_c1_g1~~TRINITY_DN3485_c1_g1_i4.p2  ORF type:complete len:159 (-),score=11.24 TRINITY_DN3485_c1_g1_i4:911-1387(-)